MRLLRCNMVKEGGPFDISTRSAQMLCYANGFYPSARVLFHIQLFSTISMSTVINCYLAFPV